METEPLVPSPRIPDRRVDEPVRCTIRVRGALHPAWADDLGGLRIVVRAGADGPESRLSGWLPDQAAVVGVLNSLYDLGRPLLSVACEASGGRRPRRRRRPRGPGARRGGEVGRDRRG
jgi:hypothetical protein